MIMKKLYKCCCYTVVSLVIFSTAAQAGGGGLGVGATEYTQLDNKLQLIKQVQEAVQQTVTLIDQYKNMLLNTLSLPETIWKDATKDIVKLRNLLNSAESLTYGAAFDDEKFQAKFPGFCDSTQKNYAAYYKTLVENWQQYIRAALEVNHLEAKKIMDDQAFIEELKKAAESSQGQHQALQAGNQIGIYMAQQLSQLRMDMQRQIELQAEYAGTVQQSSTDAHTAAKEAIGEWKELSKPQNFLP